jgi:hypothetical protein
MNDDEDICLKCKNWKGTLEEYKGYCSIIKETTEAEDVCQDYVFSRSVENAIALFNATKSNKTPSRKKDKKYNIYLDEEDTKNIKAIFEIYFHLDGTLPQDKEGKVSKSMKKTFKKIEALKK